MAVNFPDALDSLVMSVFCPPYDPSNTQLGFSITPLWFYFFNSAQFFFLNVYLKRILGLFNFWMLASGWKKEAHHSHQPAFFFSGFLLLSSFHIFHFLFFWLWEKPCGQAGGPLKVQMTLIARLRFSLWLVERQDQCLFHWTTWGCIYIVILACFVTT